MREPRGHMVHTMAKGEEVAPMQMTLEVLREGECAVVTALHSTGAQRRRMLDLGFVPGSKVCALHVSPWNDPVAYGIHGTVIALRRKDARDVQIDFC